MLFSLWRQKRCWFLLISIGTSSFGPRIVDILCIRLSLCTGVISTCVITLNRDTLLWIAKHHVRVFVHSLERLAAFRILLVSVELLLGIILSLMATSSLVIGQSLARLILSAFNRSYGSGRLDLSLAIVLSTLSLGRIARVGAIMVLLGLLFINLLLIWRPIILFI